MEVQGEATGSSRPGIQGREGKREAGGKGIPDNACILALVHSPICSSIPLSCPAGAASVVHGMTERPPCPTRLLHYSAEVPDCQKPRTRVFRVV